MERLTYFKDGYWRVNFSGVQYQADFVDRLATYENTGLTPKEVTALGGLFDYALKESKTLTEQLTLLKRIRKLAEADKEGRVVILPCKLGTKVYRIRYKIVDYPDKPKPEITTTWFTPEYREDIGKTVFLTREEAEKALQEMEGKKDGNETSM